MWFKSLISTALRRRPTRGRSSAARPCCEALEDRCLLSNYTFTDLRSLAGVPCMANDLNASGQVVGMTYGPGPARAILWNRSVVTDLGTLGGPSSSAEAINNFGQIVGYATRADGSYRGFLINPEDVNGDNLPDRWFRDFNADGANDLMIELPMQAARGINVHGQVIGSGIDNVGNYLWTPNSPNGTNGSLLALDLYPSAINDTGQIAGSAWINETSVVVLWHSGVKTILGYGSANDINASGQVVGDSPWAKAFIWTPNTPNGSTGTFSYLESIFDPSLWDMASISSQAIGLNNLGQVVGKSHLVSSGGWGEGGHYIDLVDATLWQHGEPAGLNDPHLPGMISARAINDAGQIVAEAYVGAPSISDRPLLLTPALPGMPSIRLADAPAVTEGNSGARVATFTVTLSAPIAQPVTVQYATGNGSATAGSDYQAASGTLTFAPGETSKTITVLVLGDRLAVPTETFVVNLSTATNATIADSQGVGTILDDEPRISISDVTKAEGKKNQTTLFIFTVSLSIAYDQPVTMSFKTTDGSATTKDQDYVSKTGTITFAPGETTKTITIEVKGDNKKEANETFYLDLSGLSSNSLFTKNRGVGTILNDD